MKEKFFALMLMIKLLVISGSLLKSTMLIAGPDPESTEHEIIFPTRSHVKPLIDGILSDKTWQIPIKKEYISYWPVYGETFGYATVVWLAYDDENLYFAFSCDAPDASKIKTSITRRDDIFEDDWIGIAIDTMGTKQNSYCFYVNPNGIQGDSIRSAASKKEDFSRDFVWKSAGKRTERGYQVEISIPLQSIIYKSGKTVEMGILFWRRINHSGTFGSWPERKPGQRVFENQAPIVYKDLKKSQKLEFLPSITHSRNRERFKPRVWGESENFTDIGIGLKYGLTSSMTVDLTVNPDFSQVESDAYQVEVNRRYPLFYTEKRPFFMDGAEIFNFFTIHDGFFPNAVYTRRIVDPFWGAKLTGAIGKASFGILATGDEGSGQVRDEGINPQEGEQALFGIVRGKYSLGRDNYFGIIYCGHGFAGEYNRTIGTDISYWLLKKHKINLSFIHSMSDVKNLNSGEGRFFQSSNMNLLYSHVTKSLTIQTAFEHIGKDFRMDTAFLKRTGIEAGWGMIKYHFFPNFKKLPWLKMIGPWIQCQVLHDLNTGLDDRHLNAGMELRLLKEGSFNINFLSYKENWQGKTFHANQISICNAIKPARWLTFSGSLIFGDKIYYEGRPPYKGKGFDGGISLMFHVNKNLKQQFNFSHSELSRTGEKIYDVNLLFSRTSYQVNKHFFLRAIFQYNGFTEKLLTDFLASFTFIPGTVIHMGYGGLYEKKQWQENHWPGQQENFLNSKRSFFLKASYLLRF